MFKYGSFSCSCDKIKFKGKLQNWKTSHFKRFFKISTFAENPPYPWIECIKHTENCFVEWRYRYSYTLRVKGDTEGVFYIAYHYNGEFRDQKERPYQFVIEYNPNKSGERIFQAFVEFFRFEIMEIISFDIAYDVPSASVLDVLIDTKCDVMTYGKTDNKTLYIAPKEDGCGRVKVYDKKREREEQQGIEIDDTLRIEVSMKGKHLDMSRIYAVGSTLEELAKATNHLNSVKIKRSSDNDEDWKLYALSKLSPEDLQKCLSLMTAKTKAKYKNINFSADYYTLDLDVLTFTNHITTILSPWRRWCKI
jgi:hypothetical protein